MAGGAGTAPPGDAPAGGNWVQDKYCGCKSWLCCVGLVIIGGIPGLFVPCCPCDTRLVSGTGHGLCWFLICVLAAGTGICQNWVCLYGWPPWGAMAVYEYLP